MKILQAMSLQQYILQKEFITLFLAEEMNMLNIKAVFYMESTSLNIAKSMISIDIITMLMTIGISQFRHSNVSLEKHWDLIQTQNFGYLVLILEGVTLNL
jgi:hypothetical protein